MSNQFLICIEHRLAGHADGCVAGLEPLCRDGRFEGGETILDHGAHTVLSAPATEVLKKAGTKRDLRRWAVFAPLTPFFGSGVVFSSCSVLSCSV